MTAEYARAVLAAVDSLRSANKYLEFSVGIDTPPDRARAVFEARMIIIQRASDLCESAERDFRRAGVWV